MLLRLISVWVVEKRGHTQTQIGYFVQQIASIRVPTGNHTDFLTTFASHKWIWSLENWEYSDFNSFNLMAFMTKIFLFS